MSARPILLLLVAAVVGLGLMSSGCEDDVVVSAGLPSDAEFLGATSGTLAMFPGAINPNLGLLRFSSQYELLADVQRRLRASIPSAVANAVVADETASATYDSVAGEWIITGSATSGDSLTFAYDARVAYFDTTGARQSTVIAGLTERGEFRESVDLSFRTGDFDSLASYEVQLDVELFADILVPASATEDTFRVDVEGLVRVRSKAPGDSTAIEDAGIEGRIVGLVGPRRNSNNCLRNSNAMTVLWNGLEASFQINSNGTTSIAWFDPDDTIQGVDRILFTQRGDMSCR